jgi:hypothetical protein
MARPNYLAEAFKLPYNWIPFAGLMAMGTFGHEPFLSVLAVCGEAIWLLFANNNPWLKKSVEFKTRAAMLEDRRERIQNLSDDPDRKRAFELLSMYDKMGHDLLAHDDAEVLMGSEYRRFDDLIASFIGLAESVQRLTGYPRNSEALDRSLKAVQKRLETKGLQPASKSLLLKQEDILKRRIATLGGVDIRIEQIRTQMEVIDSTFRLLYDQFNLYKTGGSLSAQVDDVLREVNALQEVLAMDEMPVAAATTESEPEPEGDSQTPNNVRRIRQ